MEIEIPITFVDRKFGASKMNKGIVKEGILGVLKLRWQSLFKDYHARMKSKGESPSKFSDEVVAQSKL